MPIRGCGATAMLASFVSSRCSMEPATTGSNRASAWSAERETDFRNRVIHAKDGYDRSRILQSQHRMEAWNAAMAVQGEHEHQGARVPREGRAAGPRI